MLDDRKAHGDAGNIVRQAKIIVHGGMYDKIFMDIMDCLARERENTRVYKKDGLVKVNSQEMSSRLKIEVGKVESYMEALGQLGITAKIEDGVYFLGKMGEHCLDYVGYLNERFGPRANWEGQ